MDGTVKMLCFGQLKAEEKTEFYSITLLAFSYLNNKNLVWVKEDFVLLNQEKKYRQEQAWEFRMWEYLLQI